MTEKKRDLIPFEETILVRINPEDSTLPIDTAGEITKGIMWINELLGTLLSESYQDTITDSKGGEHQITKFHPLTMKVFQERRKSIDQVMKFINNQPESLVKEELSKLTAQALFSMSKNFKDKQKVKNKAFEVLEAEHYNDEP